MERIKTKKEILLNLFAAFNVKRYLEIGKKRSFPDTITLGLHQAQLLYNYSDFDVKIFEQGFDLIFINGLHDSKEVVKLIEQISFFMTEDTVIVINNVNPFPYTPQAREVPKPKTLPYGSSYVGDVWKTVFYLKDRAFLEGVVVEDNPGYLIIWKSFKKLVLDSPQSLKDLPDKKGFKFVSFAMAMNAYSKRIKKAPETTSNAPKPLKKRKRRGSTGKKIKKHTRSAEE